MLLALWGRMCAAAEVEALYAAKTTVTGQTEPNRLRGFATCLEHVLIKVSGDPRVIKERRITAALKQAGRLVEDFKYRDLMADLPIHDEQGTRDRPYELTVRFAPAAIDGLLREVGRTPWGASRPKVAVALVVEIGGTSYLLTRDGDRGRDQREALAAAADRFGVPIALPDQTAGPIVYGHLKMARTDGSGLEDLAKALDSDVLLLGRLAWSDKALGWTAEWLLRSQSVNHRWQIRGVNFDVAFRNAMSGALQILSGRGAP
jgi:hypothetical protein